MLTTGPLFDLTDWDALPTERREREVRAFAAAADLSPEEFRFTGLRRCALGAHAHEIAFFDYLPEPGVTFALVPGGAVWLGYDRGHPFAPSPRQREEWSEGQAEHGLDLDTYLDQVMTPRRLVTLSPLLIETRATDRGDLEGDEDEETGEEAVRRLVCRGDRFRIPTPDEWEYACSGGPVTTLFRWGNETPPGASSYRIQGWNRHRQPNAFGLWMNDDTYQSEACQGSSDSSEDAEQNRPWIVRGGDGGASVCGGYGILETWLPLATSYSCPEQEMFDLFPNEMLWRRVVRIDR